jgi:hypothetical protein|eukprot:COSAG06_NODE_4831_length_3924_cov_46.863529_7_plen_285_part_00
MRACTASCLGSLPGDYETPRVARVPSKPLALANTCIVAFVVMFYLVYMFNSQKYLALESPDGTARLRLQAPTLEPGCVPGSRAEGGRGCPGFVDAEQLPYCDSGTPEPGQIPNIAKNYTGDAALTRPCQFRDEFFAWYPQVEHNALFATTRVTEKQQRVPAGCATSGGRKEKHCVDWATESSDVFYVSQLEDFTLLIDHSFIAPLAKVIKKENASFAMPFYTKNASFCQDRLGTIIGKALKQETRFLTDIGSLLRSKGGSGLDLQSVRRGRPVVTVLGQLRAGG